MGGKPFDLIRVKKINHILHYKCVTKSKFVDQKGRKEYINMIKVCQQWGRSDYFLYSHTAVLLFLNFKQILRRWVIDQHNCDVEWTVLVAWAEGRYRAMEPKGRIFLLPPLRDQRKRHEGSRIWNRLLGEKGNWDREKVEMKAWRRRSPCLGKDVPIPVARASQSQDQ